jgi:hydroxymethylbilane synthase
MKDVETIRPAELVIAAMLPRADVCDRLIGAESIAALPPGARVGTSSPRRAAQLLHRRPDLEILSIRGNVQTRLAKLEAGEADATLLAAAGLERLGIDAGTIIGDMLPAPAQGAVGVEVRSGDDEVTRLVEAIDHIETHACIAAERRLLEGLGGTCRSPVAALAQMEVGQVFLRAEILTGDGSECRGGSARFKPFDAEAPVQLAMRLLEEASPELRKLFAGE